MKQLASLTLLVAAALVVRVVGTPAAAPAQPDVDVRTIIDRALERSAWGQEQNFAARYRYHMSQRTREFDDDGEATKDERRHYAIEPQRGVPYPTLVTKDGEPPSGDDAKAEETRWKEFLDALDDPPDEEGEDEILLVFDNDLIDRFAATLEGVRELHGRPAFVLSFEPRPGKLPVRRRSDHALNRSRGEIWIDQATYEIARVNFELIDRVRVGWGILGSVSDARGHFERRPVGDGQWLARELDLYYHTRVLFRTTRRGETTVWDSFEPIAE